jgi:hypothetical protein
MQCAVARGGRRVERTYEDGGGLDLLGVVEVASHVVVDGLGDGLTVLDGLHLLRHQVCKSPEMKTSENVVRGATEWTVGW